MTLEEMLRGSPLNQQRMADDNAMNLAGMLARGRTGTVQQEPNMVERGLSNVKRSFYGDKNLYGNDPINPSVLDSQYVSPEMAEGAVLDVVGGPMATAWHGSPHLFKKFDMSKIGTGEGAQAYGHGLYFAENPAVATEYQRALAKTDFTKTGEGVEMRGRLPDMLDEAYEGLVMKGKNPIPRDAVDTVESSLKQQRQDALKSGDMDWFNNVADMESDLYRFKQSPSKMAGNLYKVDIPDDQIAKMLDWDKPLSGQNDHVKPFIDEWYPKIRGNMDKQMADYGQPPIQWEEASDVMGKYLSSLSDQGKATASKMIKDHPSNLTNGTHDSSWKALQKSDPSIDHNAIHDIQRLEDQKMSVQGFYDNLNSLLGGYTDGSKASEFLKSKDIPGIKYLDGSSRTGGKGTSNFVLFADDIAKILERNDQPIGDLAEELLGK